MTSKQTHDVHNKENVPRSTNKQTMTKMTITMCKKQSQKHNNVVVVVVVVVIGIVVVVVVVVVVTLKQ